MKILVTGSSGHLGEALVRTLQALDHDVVGVDLVASAFTNRVGSIVNRQFVKECMNGVESVLHTATLHKPHVGTHSRQDFVDTNMTGTLNLLEEARSNGVKSFVFTSTTSTFGDALVPQAGAPATWITENIVPVPKNIYGVTKTAAEDLCTLFHRNYKLPVVVLKTSRFFPEEDDNKAIRLNFSDANAKVNEFFIPPVDVDDIVNVHRLAMEKAPALGYGRFIISATSPFSVEDLAELNRDATAVVKRIFPDSEEIYAQRNWRMFPVIDRVYVNTQAREVLGWRPTYDFRFILDRLRAGTEYRSPLSLAVGSKRYHAAQFSEGPYPVSE